VIAFLANFSPKALWAFLTQNSESEIIINNKWELCLATRNPGKSKSKLLYDW
jgi:hypothetical protein